MFIAICAPLWELINAQEDVVLANHLFQKASTNLRSDIVQNIVDGIRRDAKGKLTTDEIIAFLSTQPRCIQMQLVARECASLRIPSDIKTFSFSDYTSSARMSGLSDDDLVCVAKSAQAAGGISVDWPGNEAKLNFASFYRAA